MKTPVDARLRAEAARLDFRFACDDCAHFDEARERCSFGYPAVPRRSALAATAEVTFVELCKAFELA